MLRRGGCRRCWPSMPGTGRQGQRDYERAWAAAASPRHWVLVRRSLTDPHDLAFSYCHAPHGRPVSLPVLIKVAGKRWPVEECLQQGKGQTGLDQSLRHSGAFMHARGAKATRFRIKPQS